MAQQLRTALAILRRKQVEIETGLSKSTIYARYRAGTFPAPIQLGPRSVGWRLVDIEDFLKNPAGYRAPEAAEA
ncbi:AlpA family transcriptional regulator [Paraburkholderia silvatlantica]|uniref:AlpA family transcriptional regulator n=1 Tax=Paraburkholderia silvatlantica TaxID=321895 RepID=A0A2V4UQX2_9BURK|nr:AlpA family phage regulatory protein [Paraburkholderia silvatlantica]PYE23146.1 AlpA family transcriptional regulator [Paraburkholderia silvatlantica]